MKRGTLVALVILLGLVGAYFALRTEPVETVKAPYTIDAVQNLARVEVVKPAKGDGEPETIVMERREGAWFLTEPVEAPMAQKAAKDVENAFTEDIGTDDIDLSEEHAKKYGLGEGDAIKVSVYPEGAPKPKVSFMLGKQLVVQETNAKRSYIRADDGEIYRAQTDLASLLSRDLGSLRSRKVHRVERDQIQEVSISHHEGESLRLGKRDGEWKLVEPEVDMEIEKSVANGIVGAIANMTATGFADDKKAADVGLEPPQTTVQAKFVEGRQTFHVSSKEGSYYVKKKGEPHIYEISKGPGDNLTATLNTLRKRVPREIEKASIQEVRFAGDDGVVVKRSDGGWKMLRPKKADVSEKRWQTELGTISKLRVNRYADVTPQEAGLGSGAERAVIKTSDGTFTLLIGGEVGEKGERYAKWKDMDDIFVVSKWTAGQFMPKPDRLIAKES